MDTTLRHGDSIADGKYIIDKELGEGGLAVVYKVRHATLDTPFAVKILKVTLPSLQDRLITEGQLQAQLQHPNVVKVTDVIKVDGFPALVMEFIDGIALDDYLNEQAPSAREAEDMFLQILDAVEEAHDRGIIHRDLKPANVMMQRTRSKMIPKVCDFGLGKDLAKEGQTRTGQQMGTPAYMAPEQIRSTKDVDQRADIFSLGAILYELLTGHRAFRASNTLDLLNAVASQPHPTPRLYIQDLEERYVQAIDGALTKNAQFRIPDCATLRRVLLGEEEWLVDRPSTSRDQDVDTLMSLGLDLTGDLSPDTAIGFMEDAAPEPSAQVSSLVTERKVHHGPSTASRTAVQQPTVTQTGQTNVSDTPPPTHATETTQPSSSKGMIFGALGLIVLVGGYFGMTLSSETPTPNPTANVETSKTVDQPAEDSTKKNTETEQAVPKPGVPDAKDKASTPQKVVSKPTSKKKSSTPSQSSTKATTTKKKDTKKVAPKNTGKPNVAPTVKETEKTKEKEVNKTTPSGETGTVKFTYKNGTCKAHLKDSSGTQFSKSVPVGSYSIHLTTNGRTAKVGSTKIKAGQTVSLTCDCMFTNCK